MRTVAVLLSLILAAGLPFAALAGEASQHKQAGCKSLIGTYLTKNRPKGESGDKFTSRSLISFGAADLALFTDSAEGGEAGICPVHRWARQLVLRAP
jgi:hypothetical protein